MSLLFFRLGLVLLGAAFMGGQAFSRSAPNSQRPSLKRLPTQTTPTDPLKAAQALDRQGLALYQAENYPAAAGAFRRACLLQSGEAVFQTHLALTLIKQEKYADLVSDFREIVRQAPDTPTPHYWLGQGLYRLHQPAQAEVELREAVQKEPGRWIYHYYLAAALRQQGKAAEALQERATADRLRRSEPRETT